MRRSPLNTVTDVMVLFVVLVLVATGSGYVRRRHVPRELAPIAVDGSRDRHLHGKARIRARRVA